MTARHFPAKESHELVPSRLDQRPAAAAWPTGTAHLWLKRAPAAIALPVPRRMRPVPHGGK